MRIVHGCVVACVPIISASWEDTEDRELPSCIFMHARMHEVVLTQAHVIS